MMEKLGTKIKKLRNSRRLTLTNLAEKVGCSVGYVSQLEKNTVNPSIAVLKKIAVALDVRLVDFFLEPDKQEEIVTKSGEGFEIKYPQGDASIFLLIRDLEGKYMEPLIARFEPGSGSSGLYSHSGGQEFGFVISGELDLMLEDKTYKLKQNDSFYFDSRRPHGYVNNGTEVSEVIWVISPPTY
ncbi:MAG: hypothetical protein B6I32_07845 [Desulfobacterium sp. 4572_20]|nr:MAG: hypothetical protein B6I32_07845 [Desulfobacterium sp. 4572_20]